MGELWDTFWTFLSLSFFTKGGNSDNGQIAAKWGTISIEGGKSDNSEIAAKWGK